MLPQSSLRILIVDDEEVIRESLGDFLVKIGHYVDYARSGGEALQKTDHKEYDIALMDIRMPEMDGLALLGALHAREPDLAVIMISAHGTMKTAIKALRLGASDFLTKPINLNELAAAIEKSIRLRGLRMEHRRLRGAIHAMQRDLDVGRAESLIVGVSAAAEGLRGQVQLAASSGCRSILITGETGTGKEVVARTFHTLASKPSDPFITLSCPSLPESLIESELFGHVRGAFTSADNDRLGAFELANGGTLFLDEISDLSLNAQAKLLRALEERKIRRLGDTQERTVQLTVVAATNRDLEDLVQKGLFRADVMFRLNVFNIQIPPLRERREDILPLARHFASKFSQRTNITLTEEGEKILTDYDYPGNVRELRNIIERAVIISGQGPILPEHLSLLRTSSSLSTDLPTLKPSNGDSSDEKETTLAALIHSKWNRRQAAKMLGISYEALRWRIKKYGLDQVP